MICSLSDVGIFVAERVTDAPAAAGPLAALIATHQRADAVRAHEKAFERALREFLDEEMIATQPALRQWAAGGRATDAEPPPVPEHVDAAHLLLLRLQHRMGLLWPVGNGISLPLERGIGRGPKDGSGLTSRKLLIGLGVLIIAEASESSDAAALKVWLEVLGQLGFDEQYTSGSPVELSRALAAIQRATEASEIAWDRRDVLPAYERLADELGDAHIVALPAGAALGASRSR